MNSSSRRQISFHCSSSNQFIKKDLYRLLLISLKERTLQKYNFFITLSVNKSSLMCNLPQYYWGSYIFCNVILAFININNSRRSHNDLRVFKQKEKSNFPKICI